MNASSKNLWDIKVLTINELTPTGDVSIPELTKIPQLYDEGYALAGQVFRAIKGRKSNPSINKSSSPDKLTTWEELRCLFTENPGNAHGTTPPVNDNYKIILPNIPKPDSATAATSSDDCIAHDEQGAAAIIALVKAGGQDDTINSNTNSILAEQLGKCEENLRFKITLAAFFPHSLVWCFVWLLIAALLLGISFLLGLGLWRVSLYVWESFGWSQAISNTFDKLHYVDILTMTTMGVIFLIICLLVTFNYIANPHPEWAGWHLLGIFIGGLSLYIGSMWLNTGQAGVYYNILVILAAYSLLLVLGSLFYGLRLYLLNRKQPQTPQS